MVAKRIGERKLLDNRYGAPKSSQHKMSDNKLGLADKVLFDFNPTTSVLNQVRTIKNGF